MKKLPGEALLALIIMCDVYNIQITERPGCPLFTGQKDIDPGLNARCLQDRKISTLAEQNSLLKQDIELLNQKIMQLQSSQIASNRGKGVVTWFCHVVLSRGVVTWCWGRGNQRPLFPFHSEISKVDKKSAHSGQKILKFHKNVNFDSKTVLKRSHIYIMAILLP